jgi:ABC-2 type transport system permease protein
LTPAGSAPHAAERRRDAPAPADRVGRARGGGGMSGLLWLSRREVLRVWKLWTQTVLAPVVSSILFIVVFGLSLGGRIAEIAGVPYQVYIVPGLIAMAMVQAAYNNNSSSVFQARSDRYMNDVLSAPMHPWQVNLGFTVGGVARSLAIGVGLTLLAVPLTGTGVAAPLVLGIATLLGLVLFSALGTVVGIFAETFDHNTFISNIVILPLAFLGGVFYSVESLPSPWQELSHVNPLFYVVEAMRYGFLGASDASPWLSLGVTAALALPTYAWAQWLFTSGRRLKP